MYMFIFTMCQHILHTRTVHTHASITVNKLSYRGNLSTLPHFVFFLSGQRMLYPIFLLDLNSNLSVILTVGSLYQWSGTIVNFSFRFLFLICNIFHIYFHWGWPALCCLSLTSLFVALLHLPWSWLSLKVYTSVVLGLH